MAFIGVDVSAAGGWKRTSLFLDTGATTRSLVSYSLLTRLGLDHKIRGVPENYKVKINHNSILSCVYVYINHGELSRESESLGS